MFSIQGVEASTTQRSPSVSWYARLFESRSESAACFSLFRVAKLGCKRMPAWTELVA
jgi:hypothetical protein